MTINDLKPVIQLIRAPEGEDLNASKVGDKFVVTSVQYSLVKANRMRDGREIVILGDNGMKNFRFATVAK